VEEKLNTLTIWAGRWSAGIHYSGTSLDGDVSLYLVFRKWSAEEILVSQVFWIESKGSGVLIPRREQSWGPGQDNSRIEQSSPGRKYKEMKK
jgi:hypothetical protein